MAGEGAEPVLPLPCSGHNQAFGPFGAEGGDDDVYRPAVGRVR